MKRLLVVTDAWEPQTNGVVSTLKAVIAHLPDLGFETEVIHPGLFATVPLPSYPEIRLARDPWKLSGLIGRCRPDTIHIATEGPLGLGARQLLERRRLRFTTSLHTKFPEYLSARTGLPLSLGYSYLRWFHRPAVTVLCTTDSHRNELLAWGFKCLEVWGRGVDTQRFQPLQPEPRTSRIRPRLLYVGRIAPEKNIEAFLELKIDADRVVVGDGPARADLQRRHPHVQWLGYRHGDALVAEYADADVLVFPSRTDTFGLVMLEAMACGTPVAAYPVTGPLDVVRPGITGTLAPDLALAVRGALAVDRAGCRAHALGQDWRSVAQRLTACLCPSRPADDGQLAAA